jgi:hypothetical protein
LRIFAKANKSSGESELIYQWPFAKAYIVETPASIAEDRVNAEKVVK